MGSSGVGRSTGESFPILYAGATKSVGGFNAKATQNIPFEILTPQIQHMTVRGTNIDAEVRTVSSSSISGSEIPTSTKGLSLSLSLSLTTSLLLDLSHLKLMKMQNLPHFLVISP